MTVRAATILVLVVDTGLWVLAAIAFFWSKSDPATKGLDDAAGVLVTALCLVTALPALALALAGRWARIALWLALAFPAGCLLLYAAAIIAFW